MDFGLSFELGLCFGHGFQPLSVFRAWFQSVGFGLSVCVSDLGCGSARFFFWFFAFFFVLLHWFLMGIGYSDKFVAM